MCHASCFSSLAVHSPVDQKHVEIVGSTGNIRKRGGVTFGAVTKVPFVRTGQLTVAKPVTPAAPLDLIFKGGLPLYKSFIALLALLFSAPFAQADAPFFEQPFLLGLHRGGSQWRPEHTVEAYKEAARLWPDALLEMDVRLTKDGVVVLHHDPHVQRTTDGKGPIEDMTLTEVQALDAGYGFTPDNGNTFPYRGKGLRIATLDEVFTALPQARWLIEPKTDGPLVAATAKVVKAHDAEERVLIASFKPAVVEQIKTLLPNAPTCFTMTSGMKLFGALQAGGDTWTNYQPDDDVLSIGKGMMKQFRLTAEQFRQVQDKGIKVQLHTLNTEEELRDGIAMGVDSILSDRPDVFEKVLNEN
jgi:glycerophosphoryl diester phosphodiesterase